MMTRLIAYTLSLILSFTAFCTGAYNFLRPEDIKCDTSDIAQYGEWYGLLGHTELLIFPEQIPASAEQAEYHYYNDANNLAPSCYVYLKCKYDAETYAEEEARLSSIDGVKKDTVHYPADACVTVLGSDETEYALLRGDNTIEYIFCCEGIHPRTPDSSCIRSEEASPEEYFSIYASLSGRDLRYWPDSWKH